MTKPKQLNLFFGDSIFETNELLTKREMIEEIVRTVEDQLWSSDDELILETAKLVGLDVVAHTDGFGLFWKKT
tara:strand:- start:24 stop:242 length:219 start_codon:yes stop_codon:yes gene_type:complete